MPYILLKLYLFFPHTDQSSAHSSILPSFVEPIPNITVAVGREAILQCTIEDLDSYKVRI